MITTSSLADVGGDRAGVERPQRPRPGGTGRGKLSDLPNSMQIMGVRQLIPQGWEACVSEATDR
ncbi:MAG: hypothetical protein ACRDRX_27095 [Pseudonocardiaceae bacterium]